MSETKNYKVDDFARRRCATISNLEVSMDEALQYESAGDESMLHREVIDEEGDVLLRSGVREFLVSSKVLALASSYFDTMFRSEFSEGCANEQLAELSDEHTIATTHQRSSDEPRRKRKTLYGSESQEVLQPARSSQQSELQLPSQPSYTSCKKTKGAHAGGTQKRPRKDEAADWFLRNAPKATEWRKRQTELELDTVEQYEQAIRAFTSRTNLIIKRGPYHGDGHSEHELVDLAEKFALLTRDSLANARLQKSFATFQALILLSYCEVLRKRGIPYTSLDRIVQKIALSDTDRNSLLGSGPWIHSIIVNLVNNGWTIFRATELFFISICSKIPACDVGLIPVLDALSLTYLTNIHNNENSRYILEHLKTNEFVKHDYSDCLRPEYTFPGLIASLLDACNNAVNRIPYG